MTDHPPAPLVSTQWLADKLGTPGLVIIDGSWYLHALNRNPHQEYLDGHIPGAVFFDLDAISSHATDLPHMMPQPTEFASAMRQLGINDGAQIVVYDGLGLFSAPRIWWMLKTFGAREVHVLDGGLPKWKAESRALEKGLPKPKPAQFTSKPVAGQVKNFDDVRAALGNSQILDARSNSRFTGEEKEPRPGVLSGHMPGAVNVHFRAVLNADGTLKNDHELKKMFAEKGVDLRAPIITSCGSGVTASILMLALAQLGAPQTSLYDGSWTEWGGRPQAEVVTG